MLSILRPKNVAPPGEKPREEQQLLYSALRYCERTVGMKRFYAAMQAGYTVAFVVRIARSEQIEIQIGDICEIKGKSYRITQVQYPTDAMPPCCDLTLTILEDGSI